MTVRQLHMLPLFEGRGLSIDDCLSLNQLTFGSLCYQRWLHWQVDAQRFRLTKQGTEQLTFHRAISDTRLHNNGRLSKHVPPRLRQQFVVVRGGKKKAA